MIDDKFGLIFKLEKKEIIILRKNQDKINVKKYLTIYFLFIMFEILNTNLPYITQPKIALNNMNINVEILIGIKFARNNN